MPEQAKPPLSIPQVRRESLQRRAGHHARRTSDEHSAAQAVRQMFDEIAPRYDFLNHVLSMNVDRLWWRRTARTFTHILLRSDARVLDLCAGTGDMSVAMRAVASRQKSSAAILALDFSHQMLQHGLAKFNAKKIQPVEADALHLPLADNSVDLVVSSSASAIWRIMTQVCARSSAYLSRKVKSAYWISANPAACWANFMASISAKYCQRSEQ